MLASMSEESRVFCPLPWSAITVQPFSTNLCCLSKDEMREGQESLIETHRGTRFTEVRRAFLKGEWPSACSLCERREREGVRSYRLNWMTWPMYEKTLRSETLTEEAGDLVYLELAGDNLCNLKCRMCSPRFSSRWNEDLPALRGAEDLFPYFHDPVHAPPVPDAEAMIPHLQSLKRLNLKGGEPLLNRSHLEFLTALARAGLASGIELWLVTNGTVLPAPFLEAMKAFKSVNITVSVDGVDPLFQYIRTGRFTAADIKRNLDVLSQHGFAVEISTAFQAYNMLSYTRILEEFRPWAQVFSWVIVDERGLGARTAPDSLREAALRRIRSAARQSWPELTAANLTSLIAFLESGRYDPGEWQRFQRYTRKLDEIRGDRLAQAEPELAGFLTENTHQRQRS
jgi:MoaA/NifB/PqqE/SkfB family radical SAM enzyme